MTLVVVFDGHEPHLIDAHTPDKIASTMFQVRIQASDPNTLQDMQDAETMNDWILSSQGLLGVGVGAILGIALAAVLVIPLEVSSTTVALVGVMSGAFGVLGTLVGACFGVKLGTEQTRQLTDAAFIANTRANTFALYVPPEAAEAASQAASEAIF